MYQLTWTGKNGKPVTIKRENPAGRIPALAHELALSDVRRLEGWEVADLQVKRLKDKAPEESCAK